MSARTGAGRRPVPVPPCPSGPLLLVALLLASRAVAGEPAQAPAPASGPHQSIARRLNATEYRNAVHDILDLEIDVDLPPDGDLHGFDTAAGALALSPALFERYSAAARRISRLAVGDPSIGPAFASRTYDVPVRLYQDVRMGDDLPFGTRGGLAVRHPFPLDGQYTATLRLRRNLNGYIRGLDVVNRVDVRLDGVPIVSPAIGGRPEGAAPRSFSGVIAGSPRWEAHTVSADEALELRFQATAGIHTLSVSFIDTPTEPEGIPQPPLSGFALEITEATSAPSRAAGAALQSVAVSGPFDATGPGTTASRRRVFICTTEDDGCATRILSALGRRAYRRRVTEEELATLLAFYRRGSAQGFDAGVQLALERLLIDPAFLFRIEGTSVAGTKGTRVVADIDLASRLSFFLWSGPPDDALLAAAERGRLHLDQTLERQVRRLLRDPRARSLVTSFAQQWLWLRQAEAATPDLEVFPDFDENLRRALVRETELFVESIFREDRSVLDLVTADYTFLNERLARHYGIPGVYGDHFRRVALPAGTGGLLRQGAIHLATSYPTRTSPVLRGRWILENLLGAPPPPPPPVIPALPDAGNGTRTLTMRERMEEHRRNPACAACHMRMDPLGLAMEHVDAIGRWRDRDEHSAPIDASTTLPDGRRLDGTPGVKASLLEQREEVVRTLVEKLLIYALGRGVEERDRLAVRAIVGSAARGGYRWSAVVLAIVKSAPFRAVGGVP